MILHLSLSQSHPQGLNVPHRIIVIDLDDDVLDMISRVAQQNNLEILIFKQDLRLAFSGSDSSVCRDD